MKGVADIGESARVTMRPEPQGVEIQVSDAAPEGVAAAGYECRRNPVRRGRARALTGVIKIIEEKSGKSGLGTLI